MPACRALVLQHDPAGGPGLIEGWGKSRGVELEVLDLEEGVDPELTDHEFLVSLGSRHASYDDSLLWLEGELALLASAHRARVPVLGICFGAQSLARALGGSTRPAVAPEIAWLYPELLAGGGPLAGPWLFWHEDRFDPPSSARLLARSPAGPAAFRLGASLGLQFHPEVDAELVDRWLDEFRDELSPHQVASVRSGAELNRRAQRDRAWALFDCFADEVVSLTRARSGCA